MLDLDIQHFTEGSFDFRHICGYREPFPYRLHSFPNPGEAGREIECIYRVHAVYLMYLVSAEDAMLSTFHVA